MARIEDAVRILKRGGIVVYPTESFYALGADATNARAIKKVFRLKGRNKKPIAVIAGSLGQVERFFFVSVAERRLFKRYWPGAVTIVLTPRKAIAARALAPYNVLRGAGARRIGVRVPAHAGARRLALSIDRPITATSANVSGKKPTKLRTVAARTFRGIVTMNGSCGIAKKPSTVVTFSKEKIQVLRRGAVNVK